MKILQLPKRYDLVVGDTFELFYKGIVKCVDSSVLEFELRYADGKSRGNSYARRYVFTPAAEDVGCYVLKITVRDNYGEAIDVGSVEINVVPRPTSPKSEKVVLLIGDSLTGPGIWPAELWRRLTATGGTPEGDGLSGIRFIGTRERDGARYEGYGGWTFDSYMSASSNRNFCMYIDGDFDVDALTQHSMYRAEDGQLWKLESITPERLKIIAVKDLDGTLDAARGPLAECGTLTYAGGGASAATILYTAAEKAEGNPFWSVARGENDLVAYAAAHGVSKVDEVVILLGWNNICMTAEWLVGRATPMLDCILSAFPSCHITLVGLQVPSRDGFGENYGTMWTYYDKKCHAFEFQNAFIGLTEREKYAGSLSFVSLAGQFDSENNYPKKTVPVNLRSDVTEVRQANGVHPSTEGYLQIADAVYRHLVARWSAE